MTTEHKMRPHWTHYNLQLHQTVFDTTCFYQILSQKLPDG
jgi:hypothetical protein